MECAVSKWSKTHRSFEKPAERLEDVALQTLKAKQCVVWLRDKLATESRKHNPRPRVYRVNSGHKGQGSNLGNSRVRHKDLNNEMKAQPTESRPNQNEKAQPTESRPNQNEKAQPNESRPHQNEKAQPTESRPHQNEKAQPTESRPNQNKKAQPTESSPNQNEKAQPTKSSPNQNQKTIGAKLMENLVVDGCGIKFYQKKSSPASYTRIWTTPINSKAKAGASCSRSGSAKDQPINRSLFAVTCFMKLRQMTSAQKAQQRPKRSACWVGHNQHRSATSDNGCKLPNGKIVVKTDGVKQRGDMNEKPETELKGEQRMKEATGTTENTRRQRSRRSLLWWFKVIKAVCRLALDMKILSMSRTDNDASSEAYYQYVVGPNTDVTLFFDKRLFSRKRGSQVPLWAQAIAIKKPHTRTDKELQMLNELMMTVRSYREKFEFSMRKLVCRVFRYTNCERGRIVIRQSHIGLGFFLVYSGSLYVQKETRGKSGRKQTDLENIIRSGQHFGEVALLGEGHRTATVICREPSELFYIERDDFTSICPNIFDDELAEKFRFAQKFCFFHDWDEKTLQKLCLLSQVLYISHGQILEDDWLKTQYIYFLMQGRISLLKKFQIFNITKLFTSSIQSQEVMKSTNGNTQQPCVAVVGHLHAGDHSELSVLNNEQNNVSGVSMVSEGVRVLRISKKNTLSLGSVSHIQKFFQKYTPRQIPSEEELCKNYHDSSKWNKFKKQILYTQLLEKNGAALAFIPASSKGSAKRERNTPSPYEKYPEFVGIKS